MKVIIPVEELQKRFPNLKFPHNLVDAVFDNAEKVDDKRSLTQNNSLHKMFQEISDDCMEKGITMRKLLKPETEVECTPENIKWIWKKIQTMLFGSTSTTELKKSGQIDIVYRNFNKLLIERTGGEISMPEFPSHERQMREMGKVEYPTDYKPKGEIPF